VPRMKPVCHPSIALTHNTSFKRTRKTWACFLPLRQRAA
jgi:hypothetical protein